MENEMSKYEADVKIFEATLKDIHEARITKHSWIAYFVAGFCYLAFFVNLFVIEKEVINLLKNNKDGFSWEEVIFLSIMQIIFYFTRQKAGSFLFGTSKGDTKGINAFAKNIASFKKKDNES